MVDEVYACAMAAGAADNISPRVRLEYYPGYYAADVLDPDGYSIEVVHKGLGQSDAGLKERCRARPPSPASFHSHEVAVFVKGVVRRFHAASLISGALISFSGLSQTGPAGFQLRVLPDQRSGFCARAFA